MATKKTEPKTEPVEKPKTKRQPLITIATGKQGGGKTFTTKQEIQVYCKKYQRPVIIIDRNGEYDQITILPYDCRWEEKKRGKSIVTINKKPQIFRIVCKKDGWDTYTKDEMLQVLFDIAKFFRNGLIVAEEMNSYIRQGVPEAFYSWFTNLRHAGIDFIGHFQRVGDAHPAVWGNAKVWRAHPTLDSVSRPSTKSKIPDYELARIAEICLQKKINQGEKYPKLYVNFDAYKITGAGKEELREALTAYLKTEGKDMVKAVSASEDLSSWEEQLNYTIERKLLEIIS